MPDFDIFIKKNVQPDAYRDLFDRTFGRQWIEWEPETLRMEIPKTWGVHPIEEVFEKIMALQTFIRTDLFWDDAVAFENIVLAFNDLFVDPDLIQQALPREIAFGIAVAKRLNEKSDFVQDIVEYIRASHREEGILVYHPELKVFQPEYHDDFRRDTAARVQELVAEGSGTPAEINEEDPVQVQFAKTMDCTLYVMDKMERSEL